MHDPMKWALPLYRAFGIHVKIHLFFFLITLPIFLRLVYITDGRVHWFDLFMITVGLVFGLILLHEYGHCFAARWVDGQAEEILIWPLGGLAYVDVPHTPRANFITTLAGPAVNFAICIACCLAMLSAGFSPLASLNPFGNPFIANTYNYQDGRTYTSTYVDKYYVAGTAEPAKSLMKKMTGEIVSADAPFEAVERAALPTWAIWVWRINWLSWWLFLFNMLIPAYPMDCGRLIHAIIWSRRDFRTATITCCYIGYASAAVMLMISFATNESILVGLALFIGFHCYRTLTTEMDTDNRVFGYDFSQGYTSLEKDDPPAPEARKPGIIQRWRDARKAEKTQRDTEERQRDDQRMDELLEKIARQGKASLTDDDRRFMERVSARYRKKS